VASARGTAGRLAAPVPGVDALGTVLYIRARPGAGPDPSGHDSVAPAALEGGSKLMVFGTFSYFGPFFRFLVAIARRSCRVVATSTLVGLAACASVPGGGERAPAALPSTAEARQALVKQRAEARWELLIKGDFDGAYQFMSAGSRETTSLERFKANIRHNAFRAIKTESVTCDGDACTVRLALTYDHSSMKGIVTAVMESWIIDGSQAWYVFGR